MSKLSDKIRIVSSDGEVLEEADKPKVEEEESIVDKAKGLFSKKEKEPVEDTEDLEDVDQVEVKEKKKLFGKKKASKKNTPSSKTKEKESVVNRVKGMLGKDRKENQTVEREEFYSRDSRPESGNGPSRYATGTGGQPTGGDPFKDLNVEDKGKKKSEKTLFIAIIAALAVVGVLAFIYAFNSSAMAAVDVEPQQIEEPAVETVLNGDHEDFTNLVEGIHEVEEVEAIEDPEDTEIKIDTPQDKEELEDRVAYLEDIIAGLEGDNKELINGLNEANDKLEAMDDLETNEGDEQ